MQVVAYDPFLSPERAVELGVEKVELDELLAPRRLHHPAHAATPTRPATSCRRETLAKTKKGVRIINCARGGLVDEAALRDAPEDGHVAGAAFDVFVEEPAKENPLFGRRTSSPRRTWAPRPTRRRRTSPCRSPSR